MLRSAKVDSTMTLLKNWLVTELFRKLISKVPFKSHALVELFKV